MNRAQTGGVTLYVCEMGLTDRFVPLAAGLVAQRLVFIMLIVDSHLTRVQNKVNILDVIRQHPARPTLFKSRTVRLISTDHFEIIN